MPRSRSFWRCNLKPKPRPKMRWPPMTSPCRSTPPLRKGPNINAPAATAAASRTTLSAQQAGPLTCSEQRAVSSGQ